MVSLQRAFLAFFVKSEGKILCKAARAKGLTTQLNLFQGYQTKKDNFYALLSVKEAEIIVYDDNKPTSYLVAAITRLTIPNQVCMHLLSWVFQG